MANSVSQKIQGALVGVLIGLLVLAFAVWGINDVFSPSARNAVISIGKEDITTREFNDAFRRELAIMARTDGQQLPHQEAYDRGVHSRVLQTLLTQKVIQIDADELGIGVNSRDALKYAAEIEPFRDDLTGKFSLKKMESVLATQNPPISRQQFEEDLIRDMRQQQTLPAINGGIVAPLEFAEQRYQYLTEQRKAQVLTITADSVPSPAEPTDEELQAYIKDNELRFTAPEYRRVTLFRFEPADMYPDLDVTEEEIKAEFDYKVELGELGSPAKRSLVQITAPNEETAKQAAERLAEGQDPATVATLLNLIEPTVYEDALPDTILDPETSEAVFAMQTGDTRVLLGSLGQWYAVLVTGIVKEERPDMNTMRDELRSSILENKAKDRLYEIAPAIDDVLDGGGTLEEAATEAGVPYATIDFVDRTGTTPDGRKLTGESDAPGIALDEIILTEIFTNDIGYSTPVFETSAGGSAAIRVDDIISSKVKPFEDIKGQARVLWQTEKTREALDEAMLELASKAQQGETLTSLANTVDNGANVEDVIIVRANPGDRVGPAVTVGLLDGKVGDIKRGPGPRALTRQIAKLTAIVSGSDGLAGEYGELMQDQMTAALRSDIGQAYQNAVLKDHELKQYPEKVRQTLGLDSGTE